MEEKKVKIEEIKVETEEIQVVIDEEMPVEQSLADIEKSIDEEKYFDEDTFEKPLNTFAEKRKKDEYSDQDINWKESFLSAGIGISMTIFLLLCASILSRKGKNNNSG